MKKILSALFLMLTITTAFAQGEAHTWTTKIDLGFQSTIKYPNPEVNDQVLSLDLGIGYNISNYFYMGVATSVIGPMGTCAWNKFFPLPVMGDMTVSFPNRTMYVPYIQARGGYSFNMTSTFPRNGEDVPTCDHILYDGTVGLIATLSEHHAIRLGVTYQRWMKANEGAGQNYHFMGGKIGYLYTF